MFLTLVEKQKVFFRFYIYIFYFDNIEQSANQITQPALRQLNSRVKLAKKQHCKIKRSPGKMKKIECLVKSVSVNFNLPPINPKFAKFNYPNYPQVVILKNSKFFCLITFMSPHITVLQF